MVPGSRRQRILRLWQLSQASRTRGHVVDITKNNDCTKSWSALSSKSESVRSSKSADCFSNEAAHNQSESAALKLHSDVLYFSAVSFQWAAGLLDTAKILTQHRGWRGIIHPSEALDISALSHWTVPIIFRERHPGEDHLSCLSGQWACLEFVE